MFKADQNSRLLGLERQMAELVRRTARLPDRLALAGPPLRLLIGILDQPLAYRSSAGALVSLWSGTPGSETVTGKRATAHDWCLLPGEHLDAGTHVIVARVGQHLYVISAACDFDPNTASQGGGGGAAGGSASQNFISAASTTPAQTGPNIVPYPWGQN